MELLSQLKDNLLIIVPSKVKEDLLHTLSTMKQHYILKIMTFEELKKEFYFQYDIDCYAYLMQKYHYKMDVCEVFLKNMYYIEDKKYNSITLTKLKQLKDEVHEQHLLITNDYFPNYLKQVDVLVYGLDVTNKFIDYTIKKIENITNVHIINETLTPKKDIAVYEFPTISEEVEFVAISILNLVDKNIPWSNIKLTNVTEEYYDDLQRIFTYYNIPLCLPNNTSIYSCLYVKKFLEYFDQTKDLSQAITYIYDCYPLEEKLYDIILDIANKINQATDNYLLQREILVNLCQKKPMWSNEYIEQVEIIDINNCYLTDNEYLFVLGTNQNSFPKIYKDEGYISDKDATECLMDTTINKNEQAKQAAIKLIYRSKNIVLTYKLATPFDEYYPSFLLNSLTTKIISSPSLPNRLSYSNLANKLTLARALDNLHNNGIKDSNLTLLTNTYPNLPYLSYRHQFTDLTLEQINTYKNNLTLSYTSINTYQLCAFRYYLQYILQLNPFTDTFITFIGRLYHDILSKCYNPEFNFDKAFNEYLENRILSNKEKLLLIKIKDELKATINILRHQLNYTKFTKGLYEQKLTMDIYKDPKVQLTGTIDKILLNNNQAIIIDYKTGAVEVKLERLIHGLNMQLPLYLYLLKNNNIIDNITPVGFYYQKVLNNTPYKQPHKSLLEIKAEQLKWLGYSIDKEEILQEIDSSYQNSQLIKGLKLTTKGFYAYSKILSSSQIDKVLELTKAKIYNCTDNIIDGKFMINPKKINNVNISCTYCPFGDVCHHNIDDIVELTEHNTLDFLNSGGENKHDEMDTRTTFSH